MHQYIRFIVAALWLLLSIQSKTMAGEASTSKHLSKEQVLAHVDVLKAVVDEKIWPTFNAPQYALEMHYYEEGPFRMHLLQADNGTEPRMECSSPEITFQAVPSVQNYEEWYAMLLHECFHGFQYKKFSGFWKALEESNPQGFVASDTLTALKQHYDWYNEKLAQESSLLIKMYEASDINEVHRLFDSFYRIRNERLEMCKERLGLDISHFYTLTETVEGSARYIEYKLYQEQGLTDTKWMTNLDSNSYYYSSGLYMMLIMDKLGIEYKDELFDDYYLLVELLRDKLNEQYYDLETWYLLDGITALERPL